VAGKNEIEEVVQEACDLLRREAARRPGRSKGMVRLAPETAARLQSVKAVPAPPPAQGYKQRPDLRAARTLDDLESLMRDCAVCPLANTRTKMVFGSGNPEAKLVFVGEAPGHDEDLQGKPFVGRAGQLLTDIIEKGMKIKRSDVYICNVLKCRPPGNRNPSPQEIVECEPYLVRQLEIIQPRVICALGAFAAQTLLKTTTTIGQLRGKWHFYHGIPVRATYHPAYLLRSPGDKGKTWADVLEVMKVYKGELTPKPQ
jgi:DNA polymerase